MIRCEQERMYSELHLVDANTSALAELVYHPFDKGSPKAWTRCCNALKKRDAKVVQAWKEEIDTLLVVAGLFSAVVTAFTIDSYKLLQQKPSNSDDIVNSFTAVRINALWFSSLVCSLASAGAGILVKQWLRAYTSGVAGSAHHIARVRQFRYEGLIRWKIPEIIALLPTLLLLALLLFCLGLLDLLWSLDKVVASTVSGIVAALVPIFIISPVLPIFWADCPYTSPLTSMVFPTMIRMVYLILEPAHRQFSSSLLALSGLGRYLRCPSPSIRGTWAFLRHINIMVCLSKLRQALVAFWNCHQSSVHPNTGGRRICDPFSLKRFVKLVCYNLIGSKFTCNPSLHPSSFLGTIPLVRVLWTCSYGTWKGRETVFVEQNGSRLDCNLLAGSDAIYMDDHFLEVIRECIKDTQPDAGRNALYAILNKRAYRIEHGIPQWRHTVTVDRGMLTLTHMVLDQLVMMPLGYGDEDEVLYMLRVLESLCRVIPFQSSLEHPRLDAQELYWRVFDTTGSFLRIPNGGDSAKLMLFEILWDMYSSYRIPVSSIAVGSIISYTRSISGTEAFYRGCRMALDLSTELPQDAHLNIQDSLRGLLVEWEGVLLTGPASTPGVDLAVTFPLPDPRMLVRLLEFAERGKG